MQPGSLLEKDQHKGPLRRHTSSTAFRWTHKAVQRCRSAGCLWRQEVESAAQHIGLLEWLALLHAARPEPALPDASASSWADP